MACHISTNAPKPIPQKAQNQQRHNHVALRASSLATTRGIEMVWRSSNAPSPENGHQLTHLAVPWKTINSGLSFTWSESSLCTNITIPKAFVINNQRQRVNISSSRESDYSGAVHRRLWEALMYSSESRSLCACVGLCSVPRKDVKWPYFLTTG